MKLLHGIIRQLNQLLCQILLIFKKVNVMKKFISKFSINHSDIDSNETAQRTDSKGNINLKTEDKIESNRSDVPARKVEYSSSADKNGNGFVGSVFAEGLIIHGSVSSNSNIKILGSVEGNVSAEGDIILCGKVSGDIHGVNVILTNAEVKGNIVANTCIVQNKNSVVTGNITTSQLDVSGVVNGDLKISESIAIRSTAEITGNIETKLISVSEGAVINSQINVNK